MNIMLCTGEFAGGELEPGTFHYFGLSPEELGISLSEPGESSPNGDSPLEGEADEPEAAVKEEVEEAPSDAAEAQ